MKLNQISLRERKYAQTKVDLLKSMLEKTRDKKFSEISIKELCEDVMISEATFFNYFPKKTDLILYFIKMWSMQVSFLADKQFGRTSGLRKIEFMFEITGSGEAIGNERIMGEILAFIALEDLEQDIDLANLTDAELMICFPELDGIETIARSNYGRIFLNNIELAVRIGELPINTDIKEMMLYLRMVFYGLPLVLGIKKFTESGPYFRKLLNEIWEIAFFKYDKNN